MEVVQINRETQQTGFEAIAGGSQPNETISSGDNDRTATNSLQTSFIDFTHISSVQGFHAQAASSFSYCLRKQSPAGKNSQHRSWYSFQTYVSWPVYSVSSLLMRCIRKNLKTNSIRNVVRTLCALHKVTHVFSHKNRFLFKWNQSQHLHKTAWHEPGQLTVTPILKSNQACFWHVYSENSFKDVLQVVSVNTCLMQTILRDILDDVKFRPSFPNAFWKDCNRATWSSFNLRVVILRV